MALKIPQFSSGDAILIGGGALLLFVMAKGWKGVGSSTAGAVIDLVDGVLQGTWDGLGLNKIDYAKAAQVASNNGTAQGQVLGIVTKAFDWGFQIPQKVFNSTNSDVLKGNNAWGMDMTGGW